MTLTLANGVTPLVTTAIFHLVIGNAIIGIVEGIVAERVCGLRRGRAILIAIAANYFSAWVAILALFGTDLIHWGRPSNGVTLQNLSLFLWACFAGAALLTLVLEWPFFLLLARLGRRGRPVLRSIACLAAAHAASMPLVMLFWRSAEAPWRNVAISSLDETVPAETQATVYYLHDYALHAIEIDGALQRTLRQLGADEARHTYLQWRPSEAPGGEGWRLLYGDDELFEQAEGRCVPFHDRDYPGSYHYILGTMDARYGAIADLRDPNEQSWRVRPVGRYGLRARHEASGEWIEVVLHTPVAMWTAQCVSILPGNFVVFEFEGQICVLSLETRRLALLTLGRSPVVVLDEGDVQ